MSASRRARGGAPVPDAPVPDAAVALRDSGFDRALEGALERAMNDMGDGTLVFSRSGILAVSDAFCEIVGRTRQQLLAVASPVELLIPEERGDVGVRVERSLAGENVVGSFETRAEHADGHPVDITLSVRAVEGQDADRVLIMVARDVSQALRRDASLRLLAEASGALASPAGEAQPLRILVDLAVRDLADVAAAIPLVDGNPGHALVDARDPSLREHFQSTLAAYPPDLGAAVGMGRVLRTGRTELSLYTRDRIDSIAQDEHHAQRLADMHIRSVLNVALPGADGPTGVLSLLRVGDARPFDTGDARLAEELAARCSKMLDRSRALDALRRRERHHAGVADLGRIALEGAPLPELRQRAAEAIAAMLEVPFVEVLEPVSGQGMLRLAAGTGWHPGVVGVAQVASAADSYAGYTLISGAAVIVRELATEARFSDSALLVEHAIESSVTVAIRGRGERPHGVLGAHDTRRRAFTPDDVHVLEVVANVLASAAERREVEDALRESEQRLELALAASETGTWDWDMVTGALRWSPNLAELHGLPPGSGPPAADAYRALIHPDDVAVWERVVGRAATEGRYDVEFRLRWPDGSIHWMAARGMVLYDDAGHPARMIGTARDVTDHHAAQE